MAYRHRYTQNHKGGSPTSGLMVLSEVPAPQSGAIGMHRVCPLSRPSRPPFGPCLGRMLCLSYEVGSWSCTDHGHPLARAMGTFPRGPWAPPWCGPRGSWARPLPGGSPRGRAPRVLRRTCVRLMLRAARLPVFPWRVRARYRKFRLFVKINAKRERIVSDSDYEFEYHLHFRDSFMYL